MAKKTRLCRICGQNPAEVPDRDTMNMRLAVCRRCHAERLSGDLAYILLHSKGESREEPPNGDDD